MPRLVGDWRHASLNCIVRHPKPPCVSLRRLARLPVGEARNRSTPTQEQLAEEEAEISGSRWMKPNVVIVAGAALVLATACTVNVKPPLSPSLGMSAFDAMKVIDQREVAIALYIDPKIKDLEIEQKIKQGKFRFPIGSAFSVKLVKALAYHFDTVVLTDQPAYSGTVPVDGLMRVTLQDVDVNMGVKPGFATVKSESYTRLSVRAELQDLVEQKTVWVGTTQAQQSGTHQELGQMTYQEAGRGFGEGIDRAIDEAVGDLLGQMARSANLAKYLELWESRPQRVAPPAPQLAGPAE